MEGGVNTINLAPQCEDDSIKYNGKKTEFTIRNVTPAFNIPVDKFMDTFLAELQALGADNTWKNDYDDFDVFHHKATRALRNTIDHTDPAVEQCSSPAAVIENIGPQAEQRYNSWRDVAVSWAREWLKIYNSILNSKIEDNLNNLATTLSALHSDSGLSEPDIQTLTDHYISGVAGSM